MRAHSAASRLAVASAAAAARRPRIARFSALPGAALALPRGLRAAPELVDRSCANGIPGLQDLDAIVVPEVISEAEHDAIVEEVLHKASDRAIRRFRKRRYEQDHWDSVIVGYKEIERPLPLWTAETRPVLERIYALVGNYLHAHVDAVKTPDLPWLPPHIIDLAKDGVIKAHVDSIKFSGEVVSGLSLLSTRVMRLRPARDDLEVYGDDDPCVDLTLPPRSLYILCNAARFHLAHSVEPSEVSERRLSIVFRDALVEASAP
mmetsp:Transcript_1694/g.3841  ORF Transcript_1694/g.3841 Transcript_1694/m.3841 type:complete len:262 (+) Transcript_1694:279-1064(+)